MKIQTLFSTTYVLLVLVLATATLVEDHWGTALATNYIYGHWWFVALWALLAATGAAIALKKRVWEHIPSLLMHVALGTILLGALLSYTTGEQGYVHLVKNGKAISYESKDRVMRDLPFVMELDSFSVKYYAGTTAPMDYVSYMKVDGKPEMVSMNRNFVKDGYRFIQSSYDENGNGSWISMNHDPYGANTTFAGYLLFVVSGALSLIWPTGTFRKLLKNPLLRKGGLLIVVCLTGTYNANSAEKLPVIPKDEAKQLERTQVVYQERVVPYNTVAIDFVKKITGKSSYKGLAPEQVLAGWSMAPEKWRSERMIKVKNRALRQQMGMDGDYCSLDDLFDADGKYRLQALWEKEQQTPGVSKLEKGISEIDEKVGILLMLANNTLIKPLPKGSNAQLSESKVTAELLYNKLPLSKVLFMCNLTLGLLSFGFFLYKGISSNGAAKWSQMIEKLLPNLLLAALLAHSFGYGLRWYISGRIPLNNGYETMQFLALCVMAIALALSKRYRFVLSFGFLLSGFTLLVSYIGQMNPQITPLMPVLNSPWLSTHVSFIMMSYALLSFTFLNSVFALVLHTKPGKGEQVEQLTLINKLLIYPATVLLGTGILLGAVWASESWGNYWTWDPKEVWALVTLMVYGAVIALPESQLFCKPRAFHTYMLAAFGTVLMTYFGVNYLLGGMHSYAG